ncbi:SDR family oxidoreductase [Rhizobium leguminosarum]|uniref:SDR family oxidoreductase n=1 Tax=Rhizobium leguminosarum TaxID=384 RepID=UPI001C972EC5|nr:SDR family oxidoreductase [Rhizobium leguminosarum]
MATLMGRKIIVIGGNSGIGLGVAAAALKSGAEVVIVSRSNEKLQTAKRTLAADVRVSTFAADMTQEAEIARLFDEIGVFDHLVSTAGTPPPGDPIARTDIDLVRSFIDNKLVGAVLVTKHAVRSLKRGGSLTFTSGINKDKPPVPGGAVVSAVAGSFSYLAHALSLELAPTRVNVVSPGWVDTPMFEELAGDAKSGFFEGMAARLPVGRIATPADIAPAYIYAMESDFTTGQTIHIDGGQSLI